MSIIVRIDVDRPYGRQPLTRHLLSRMSSDLYLPKIAGFGYLAELKTMLGWLNDAGAKAYAFFRRCTLPSLQVLKLMEAGGHEAGLHLENSRSLQTLQEEKKIVEQHCQRSVSSFSKHGSGGAKFGFHHYAPYEPEKYVEWAQRASMRVFLGNLEDPLLPSSNSNGLQVFPSAFWLEPHWRDTNRFTVDWLIERAHQHDVVLLVHPENVLADADLVQDFKKIIRNVDSRIL